MKWYLFAKFYQGVPASELFEISKDLGFDGPTALVREGYWTEEGNLAKTLPVFVSEASKHGQEVKYADTSIYVMDPGAEEQYRILAGEGIERVRLDYVKRVGDYRLLAETARAYAERACELGAKYGIQSVIQLHGWFYPQNATGAWPMVKGLDPRYIGVKIDPGNNNCQEGFEFFEYQVGLLREYVTAVGAKDACALRLGPCGDDKGWTKQFVPAYAGETNWVDLYSQLKKVNFSGPNVLMPFYEDHNSELRTEMLRKELQYLKDCWEKVE